jgi:hypothetical protein
LHSVWSFDGEVAFGIARGIYGSFGVEYTGSVSRRPMSGLTFLDVVTIVWSGWCLVVFVVQWLGSYVM